VIFDGADDPGCRNPIEKEVGLIDRAARSPEGGFARTAPA